MIGNDDRLKFFRTKWPLTVKENAIQLTYENVQKLPRINTMTLIISVKYVHMYVYYNMCIPTIVTLWFFLQTVIMRSALNYFF